MIVIVVLQLLYVYPDRIATLMNTRADDSDSDDEHQAFYTGGSEHGGYVRGVQEIQAQETD